MNILITGGAGGIGSTLCIELAKNGHTDVNLVDLPREMTKAEIAQHMVEVGFGKGNAAIEAAVAYVAKKNPAAKQVKATVAKTEAVVA